MNIDKKTIILEVLGFPGQSWGYPGSVLGHEVENEVGELNSLDKLLVAFNTIGQLLNLLWSLLGFLLVDV